MGQLLKSGDSNGRGHASAGSGSGEVEGASSRDGRRRRLFVILSERLSKGDALRLRRGWLRFLDAPLTSEIRTVGALDLYELAEAAPQILRSDNERIRVETIEEWWEFAWRRSWLERAGRRCRLTETARADLRAERERMNSPDPMNLARWLAGVTITSAVGIAGLLSRNLEAITIILIVVGVIVVSLLLAGVILPQIERPLDRWFARLACDSLEGPSEIRRLQTGQTLSHPKRLYDADNFESPGRTASSPLDK